MRAIPGIAALLLFVFVLFACREISPTSPQIDSTKQPLANNPSSKTYPDRYEIRDVRNGMFAGTVLLDKESGRVWIMAQSGTGSKSVQDFEEIVVDPMPCSQSVPSGNGMCRPTIPGVTP